MGVFYEPPEHDEVLVQQKALYQWKNNRVNRLVKDILYVIFFCLILSAVIMCETLIRNNH